MIIINLLCLAMLIFDLIGYWYIRRKKRADKKYENEILRRVLLCTGILPLIIVAIESLL